MSESPVIPERIAGLWDLATDLWWVWHREAREVFSEEELVKLTLSIVAINGWNRLSIAFGATPGTYKAGSYKAGTLLRGASAAG